MFLEHIISIFIFALAFIFFIIFIGRKKSQQKTHKKQISDFDLYKMANRQDWFKEIRKQEREKFENKFINLSQYEKITVRLLPPRKGNNKLFSSARLHKLADSIPLFCLGENRNGRWLTNNCPICDHYNKTLEKINKNQAEPGEARKFKPYERHYYNVIIRGEENKGPKVLSIGKILHEKIIAAIIGNPEMDEPGMGNGILDMDFKIIRRVRPYSPWPDYSMSKFISNNDKINFDKEDLYDLEAILNKGTPETLKSKLERSLN